MIVGDNPIHLNLYIFYPSSQDVANALPPPVNELERRSAVDRLDAMDCKQKGFHCPRCFSTNTQFVGNQKPANKKAVADPDIQIPTWQCNAAKTVADSSKICVCAALCPVCRVNPLLMQT